MRWLHPPFMTTLLALLVSQGCGNQGVMTSPFAATTAIRTTSSAAANAPRYANRVVVKFRNGATDSQIRSFQQRFSLRTQRDVSALGLSVMSLPAGANDQESIARLQGHPAIEFAEPDYIFSLPSRSPRAKAAASRRTLAVGVRSIGLMNDLRSPEQWGLAKIGVPKAWALTTGSPGVIVAVVDTGVDMRHPDLQANLVPGYSVLPHSSGPDDDHGHGTHVAGVIAASGNNGIGITGIAPNTRLMPVKVLNSEGKGGTGDIVTGLLWAVNNGAKVINMSLGGTGGSRALMAAIQYAQSKDVVLVAAMGNDGLNSQEYPAGYPGVIAVGATDERDELTDFSNFGSWISVTAPGSEILSTLPTHSVNLIRTEGKSLDYDVMDGTSMASPFVAGVAALIRAQNPTMSASAVKSRIEKTATDLGARGYDERFGFGRIDAARAVSGN